MLLEGAVPAILILAWPPPFFICLTKPKNFLGKASIWAYIGYRKIFKEGKLDAER